MNEQTIPGRLLHRTLRFANSFSNDEPNWKAVHEQFRQLYKLKSAVVHESGHAIANWLSPTVWAVVRVTVEGSLGSEGRCISLRPFPLSEPACWEEIVCGLSGMAAERMVWPDRMLHGADADVENTLAMASRLQNKTNPPWIDEHPVAVPDEIWYEDLWRVHVEHSEVVELCYRRAMVILARNSNRFIRLCHKLNQHKKLHAFGVALALGPRPLVSPVAAVAATAIDTCRELRPKKS